jgi:hypothetical protein
MKLTDAITKAAALLSPKAPILWAGPPGSGKTDGTEEVARLTGRRHMVTHPVTRLPEDYNGIARLDDTGARWFPIGQLAELVADDCPPTLLVVDDVAQARGPTQAAIMHLVLARTVAERPLHPNVAIMLCTNRRSHDPLAANDLSSALANRCRVWNIEHDYEGFARWIIAHPEHDPIVASYALFHRDCFVSEIPDTDGIPVFCSPRSMAGIGLDLRRAPHVMDKETIAGAIGEAEAGNFIYYRDTWNDLEPLDTMLQKPGLMKQFTDLGLVCAYLVQAAARAESEPDLIRDWVGKLHGEFQETMAAICPSL